MKIRIQRNSCNGQYLVTVPESFMRHMLDVKVLEMEWDDEKDRYTCTPVREE